jgi:hypothetical protein
MKSCLEASGIVLHKKSIKTIQSCHQVAAGLRSSSLAFFSRRGTPEKRDGGKEKIDLLPKTPVSFSDRSDKRSCVGQLG